MLEAKHAGILAATLFVLVIVIYKPLAKTDVLADSAECRGTPAVNGSWQTTCCDYTKSTAPSTFICQICYYHDYTTLDHCDPAQERRLPKPHLPLQQPPPISPPPTLSPAPPTSEKIPATTTCPDGSQPDANGNCPSSTTTTNNQQLVPPSSTPSEQHHHKGKNLLSGGESTTKKGNNNNDVSSSPPA